MACTLGARLACTSDRKESHGLGVWERVVLCTRIGVVAKSVRTTWSPSTNPLMAPRLFNGGLEWVLSGGDGARANTTRLAWLARRNPAILESRFGSCRRETAPIITTLADQGSHPHHAATKQKPKPMYVRRAASATPEHRHRRA